MKKQVIDMFVRRGCVWQRVFAKKKRALTGVLKESDDDNDDNSDNS